MYYNSNVARNGLKRMYMHREVHDYVHYMQYIFYLSTWRVWQRKGMDSYGLQL